MRFLLQLSLFIMVILTQCAWPGGGWLGSTGITNVQTENGTTNCGGPTGLKVSNSTLTCNSDGTASITTGGGGGGTPGGSDTQVQYNSSGSFAGNSGFVFVSTNVGIGSATPGQKLDVGGTVSATGFTSTGSSTGNTNYIGANLGIGSTNPGQQLDVSGTVRMVGFVMTTGASSNYVLTSNGSGVGSWAAASGGSPGGSSGTLQWNSSSSFAGVSGSGVDSNGNVGIGSATPGQKLDVSGTVRITNSGTAANPSLVMGTGNNVGIWSPATNTLAISVAGAEKVRIDSNGNVGIGSTAPGALLDVQGSLRVINSGTPFSVTGVNVGIGTTTPPNALYVVGTPMFTTGLNIGIGTASPTRLCIANNAIATCAP